MRMIDYTAIAFTILGAVFWFKSAQLENRSPVARVALSLGVSGLVMIVLHGSWLAVLMGQLVLVVIFTLYRTLTEKPSG